MEPNAKGRGYTVPIQIVVPMHLRVAVLLRYGERMQTRGFSVKDAFLDCFAVGLAAAIDDPAKFLEAIKYQSVKEDIRPKAVLEIPNDLSIMLDDFRALHFKENKRVAFLACLSYGLTILAQQ